MNYYQKRINKRSKNIMKQFCDKSYYKVRKRVKKEVVKVMNYYKITLREATSSLNH